MYDIITQMGPISTIVTVFLLLFAGFKAGRFFAARKSKQEMYLIDKERNHSSRSYKKLLDDENIALLSDNERLKEDNARASDKIIAYRKKLAGMGMFSFAGSRKRADVLYSLLLENEALEQLLTDLSKREPDEKSDYLLHQMKDIQRRHRLMAKIFDEDGVIKHHVQDILFNNERTDSADDNTITGEIVEAPPKDGKGPETLERN